MENVLERWRHPGYKLYRDSPSPQRDLVGILIAIIGAVTVVLAANGSDTRLDPVALVKAIRQLPFLIYSCIYAVGAIVLAVLSQGPIGRQHVFVDVGLCALFGK